MGCLTRAAVAAMIFFVFCEARADGEPGEPAVPGIAAGPSEAARWRVMLSPLTTLHFSSDSDHKPVALLGLERERPDGVVWGGAVFSNSFGQPSAYLFGGQRLYRWSPMGAAVRRMDRRPPLRLQG